MSKMLERRAERDRNAESLRIMKGGGCWICETPNNIHGCIGPKTANGASDCTACPFYVDFYDVAHTYAENEGITKSESIWLALQFFGIDTKYMCDGHDGEWYKEFDPKRYADLLKRQAELMGDKCEPIDEEPAPIANENGQMSIMEWLLENR